MKFTEALKEKYLQNIRDGMRRGAAAEALKLKRRDVYEYLEDNPDFLKEVMYAELEANEHVEEALYQGAVSGNVAAARAWIELRGGGARPAGASAPPGTPQPDDGSDDPFAALDNVEALDPRRRRR